MDLFMYDTMRLGVNMEKHRIYSVPFVSIYPQYVAKAIRKGNTKEEVDQIICWLTGHNQSSLEAELAKSTTVEAFFVMAPHMNLHRKLITGIICGVRVEEIEDPVMREIRYLDKLIDELANGKAMEKILRKP